jgi:uncharacterized membrane protein
MNNIKIGLVLVIISLLFGGLFFYLINQLQSEQMEYGCLPQTEKCGQVESNLNITHGGIGIIVAAFTLGLYLILFSKGEKAILQRLEEEKESKLKGQKFDILLRAFDKNEQSVLNAIRSQPGIEQNTLRLKTDISKAKISQILTSLEKKKLIYREAKKKTYSIYLSDEFNA